MLKPGYLIAILIMLMPVTAVAEKVEGTLDKVSFSEGIISVSGMIYEVNTDETKVTYRGSKLGEEDLRPGDDVVLIMGKQRNRKQKRQLEAVILVRGGKMGLES